MKQSTFMLAFVISTAVHVGALTSNLLHVNVGSIPEAGNRAVKLHIIAPPVRELPAQIVEQSQSMKPEVVEMIDPEQPVDPIPDIPEMKSPEIVLTETPTAVQLPAYREQTDPPNPPTISENLSVEESPEEWTDSPSEISNGSQNIVDACSDCYASIASVSSPVPARLETGDREVGSATPATITLSSKPTYPRYSRLYKEEGTTVLEVEILPDGRLGKVEVVQSSGYRRLDRAAVEGMQKAELVAAVKDGRKIASVKRISIRFDLEDWGE